jgi:predicted transcriptional regulator of viral defense system
MKYDELIRLTSSWPVIETSALRGFVSSPTSLEVQLSRWVKSSKLVMLRRGVYLLPKQYRKVESPPAYLANILVRPSFVSFEYALEFHSMIPDRVHLMRCITTSRPQKINIDPYPTQYHHIGPARFFGFYEYPLETLSAFIASAERALLDIVYFSKGAFSTERLSQLRLQNLAELNLARLSELAQRFDKKRVIEAAKIIDEYVTQERKGWEEL